MPSFPTAPVLGYSFTTFSTNYPGAQQPGVAIDAEINRTNTALAQLMTALRVSFAADGTLLPAAVELAYGLGTGGGYGENLADAPSAASALLAQAWAEYLPGAIPADTLITAGITGQHYSAAWWANQAATSVSDVTAQITAFGNTANTAATAAASSATAAGTSATNAGSSATAAAGSATSALASALSATGSANTAGTASTNANTKAAAAATSAAAALVSQASAAANAAAGAAAGASANQALIQAGLAAASATFASGTVAAAAAQVALATTQAGLATTNGAAQVALATTQAGLATTNGAAQVALATAQVGITTAAGAAQVALATDQAMIATGQATIATDQATISTDQATISTDQATAAAASAAAAAAAATGLPAMGGNGLSFMRVNSAAIAYEYRTPVQMRTDLGVPAAASPTLTGTATFSGTLTGTGITSLFASPPVLGGTAAAAASFTTLAANSTVSGAGFTARFATPGPVGSTSPSTGSFTTLAASATISGTGFSNYLASPPAIGSAVPGDATFANLTVNTTIAGAALSDYLLSPPAIGSTAPNSATFTTLTSNGITTAAGKVSITGTNRSTAFLSASWGVLDAKYVDILYDVASGFSMRFLNDAQNAANAFFTVTRPSGYAIGTMTLTAPTMNLVGAVVATSINSTPIGAITPSTGGFTTLSATGATALAAVTATAPAVNDNSTKVPTTAWINQNQFPAFGKNLIHNQTFTIWARGTGPFTGSGTYTADRWSQSYGGAGASMSTTRIVPTDADRTAIGDEARTNAMQITWVGTSGSTDFVILTQRMESVRTTSGKTITVSWTAKATVGGVKMGLSYDQNFGTGGSPSTTYEGPGQSAVLTTTPVRYSKTIAIPTTIGKTLGTNGGSDWWDISFWFSSGGSYAVRSNSLGQQSGTVTIYDVQVEIGSVATPLEMRSGLEDQRLCKRFFQQFVVQFNGTSYGAGPVTGPHLIYPVQMRGTPSVGWAGLSYGNASAVNHYPFDSQSGSTTITSTIAGGCWAQATMSLNADL